jgi:hypothetical protein
VRSGRILNLMRRSIGTVRLRGWRGLERMGQILAGWVARTRPLAGPLSPRGPQPVDFQNAALARMPQWADSPTFGGTRVVVPSQHRDYPAFSSNTLDLNRLEWVVVAPRVREVLRSPAALSMQKVVVHSPNSALLSAAFR